jgi:hypothetical protein
MRTSPIPTRKRRHHKAVAYSPPTLFLSTDQPKTPQIPAFGPGQTEICIIALSSLSVSQTKVLRPIHANEIVGYEIAAVVHAGVFVLVGGLAWLYCGC